MSRVYVDLHTHSSASDGADSPVNLVRKAKKAGLSTLALTDHETLAGLDEAAAEAHMIGLNFIRGVEVAACWPVGELHLLGYFISEVTPTLESLLHFSQQSRVVRNKKIVDKLQELGIDIQYQGVVDCAGTASPGRPHIAQLLVETGVVPSVGDAFSRYLGHNGSASVARQPAAPQQVIQALASSGATVSLAHPCLIRNIDEASLHSLVEELVSYGLDAIEVYHSSHNAEQTRMLLGIAAQYNLVVTGGSDYHGSVKPHVRLGRCGGGRVPVYIVEKMKQHRIEHGQPV